MIHAQTHSPFFQKKQKDAQKWRRAHSYAHLGLRLTNILTALKKQQSLKNMLSD